MLDFTYYDSLVVELVSPVDSIVLTDCLRAITWGLPAHEAGTAMTYQGTMSVSLSCQAEARGLTVDSFSQKLRPSLWLPGTAQLRLTLGQHTLRFRISQWQFDAQTKVGQCTITQQLALYNVSIPDADAVFPSPYEAPVASIVYRAAQVTNNWANDKIQVGTVKPYPFAGDSSTVYGQLPANNLWSEAQALLTHTWGWLTQSLNNELVNAEHLNYDTAPLLLTRPGSQASVKSEQTLSFVAPRVIAHGSADLPASNACQPDSNASDNGYPDNSLTYDRQKLSVAMPDFYEPTVLAEADVGSKYIKYYYRKPGRTKLTNGPAGVSSQVLSWEPEDKLPMNEQSQLWKTVQENSKSLGRLFPDTKAGVSELAVYERITETYTERVTERALGVVFPDKYPGVLAMTEVSRERLNEPPKDDKKCGRDVITGGHVTTTYVKPAPVSTVPKPLETKLFRSEAALVPDYRPALDFPYLFDIGWCPDASFADLVSQRVVVREKSRSVTDAISMALPYELISKYCPVFWRCVIGNRLYFADQVQYAVEVGSEGEVKAGVSFTGCLLATVQPVPEPAPPALYFGSANTAEALLASYTSTVQGFAGIELS